MNQQGPDRTSTLLSVVIIARDEERNIARALAGLADFVDEVVVVDTGSTDRTREVARTFGARVVEHVWQEDFAAARNRGLDEALGEWILVLDADEEVDLLNGTRLRRTCQMAPDSATGFLIDIISQAEHRRSGVEIHHVYPRLFRNHRGIRFQGAVHEEPLHADGSPVAAVAERLPITILHFGYSDPRKNRFRVRRNLRILEYQAGLAPERVDLQLQLGAGLLIAGHLREARRVFETLLERGLDERREVIVRENLALALNRLEEAGAAAAQLERVLELAPRRRSARLMRAQLLRVAGEPEAALRLVQSLAEDPGGDDAAAQVYASPAVVYTLAGECRLDLHDLGGARQAAEAALAVDAGFAGAESLLRRIDGVTARLAPAGHTVAAAIIARNAAGEIARCIASLSGAVDDIVVVDTGSTDGTAAVARSAGARVVDFAWCDDFAAARNAALDVAQGDWILVIDSDECLAPGSAPVLRSVVESGRLDAARILIESPTQPGDPLAVQVERSIRLFRRLPGVRYTRPVHEQIEPALAAIGARVDEVPVAIEHHGYSEPALQGTKRRRNLRLMEAEISRHGGVMDGLLAFHYGLTLAGEGRDHEAIAALETAIEPARGLHPALCAHAHARLAQLHLGLDQPETAAAHADESLAAQPGDVFARYIAAGCRFRQGDPAGAAVTLQELLEAPTAAILRPGLVQLDLGDALAAAGDLSAAARAFAAAAQALPHDPRPAARLRKITQSRQISRSDTSF